MIFVISIVPFLSAVAIAFLYESGFWMAIISGGRLFQALMLLGRNETIQCVEYVSCMLCLYLGLGNMIKL